MVMENLLIPFLTITPVILPLNIYRAWLIIIRRIRITNRAVSAIYLTLILATLAGYVYLGIYCYRCVWPGQCGEGFASGYIAAAVLLGLGAVSLVFLLTEIIYAVAKKQKQSPAMGSKG
jgi:hypothetical protein